MSESSSHSSNPAQPTGIAPTPQTALSRQQKRNLRNKKRRQQAALSNDNFELAEVFRSLYESARAYIVRLEQQVFTARFCPRCKVTRRQLYQHREASRPRRVEQERQAYQLREAANPFRRVRPRFGGTSSVPFAAFDARSEPLDLPAGSPVQPEQLAAQQVAPLNKNRLCPLPLPPGTTFP
jgi:hypothetical protein